MSEHAVYSRDGLLRNLDRALPSSLRALAIGLLFVGAAAFIGLAFSSQAQRAWSGYLLNWLFWTGISLGLVMFHAVTNVAKGRWSAPLLRFGDAGVAFLPVSCVLFLLLWLGKAHLWPWIAHPIHEPHVKEFWLRAGFMFARDAAALLAITGLALWLVYHSVRPDAALLAPGAPARHKSLYDRLTKDYATRGEAASVERRTFISPLFLFVSLVGFSVIVFDTVMSIVPFWVSNLLGGFFFMGAWLSGLMTLALLTMNLRRYWHLEDLITTRHLHDLGKMCFGFTVFWAYTLFSQFIVIWYGNMPEETSFLMLRMMGPEWRGISIAMIVMAFLLPFWGLISQPGKKTPAIFSTFAIISLMGLWTDRFVFTVPSIVQETADHGLPLGWQELLITAGFAGAWLLCYQWFAARFPMVSPTLVEHFGERRHSDHQSS